MNVLDCAEEIYACMQERESRGEEMDRMPEAVMTLNYIGSKVRMMSEIARVLCPLIENVAAQKGAGRGVVLGDYFAGSGSVANYIQHHPRVKRVVACDQELYSYILNRALLKCVYTRRLARVIRCLNDRLKGGAGRRGLVWQHYSPKGGRMYFTEENARRIDFARRAINVLYARGTIGYSEFLFLLASIITSCSKYSNTASCFRAFVKTFSSRSLKEFLVSPIHMMKERLAWKRHHVIKNDVMRVAKHEYADIIYLDPPYTTHHYGGYYGFYNYLSVYRKEYKIHGVSGGPVHYNKSAFGMKSTALKSFKQLIDNIKKGCKYIVMSYNADGTMNKDDIIEILGHRGNVKVYELVNRKFRTHQKVDGTRVVEFLFVCSCWDDDDQYEKVNEPSGLPKM